MKKNLLIRLLLTLTCGSAVFCHAQTTLPTASCSHLSPQEQQFAERLADMDNRTLFCNSMTAEQRQKVMEMAGQPNASGGYMNPDQALQQHRLQNNVPAPSQVPQGRSGGGCPVK